MQDLIKISAFYGFLAPRTKLGEGGWSGQVRVQNYNLFSLPPAEHLLFCKNFSNCFLQLLGFQVPPAWGKKAEVKTATKPFLVRRQCSFKISSRLVQGIGFSLPHYRQTNKHLHTHLFIYIDNCGMQGRGRI